MMMYFVRRQRVAGGERPNKTLVIGEYECSDTNANPNRSVSTCLRHSGTEVGLSVLCCVTKSIAEIL